ncbi:MAG: FAD-linked oxidase C-terminal domain-containing protein [Acidimicrobiia bacterium]
MDLTELLTDAVGAAHVLTGDAIGDDYTHDEALTSAGQRPGYVVRPAATAEVAAVLRIANEHRVPVTGRGAGTGMSGAGVAVEGGILVSFERMNEVLEIDEANHMAVVQPGVTLDELDKHLAPRGLVYPVFPGEYSASLGGNVNTNAGGMRAVKYGVTRHHVIGLEAVLASGEVIRTGGKIVKSSTGYDLTQLVVGSEGTLALVTEATLRLYPRAEHQATVLAPFATLDEVTEAIPRIVASGVGPLILEYIDMMTMAAMSYQFGIDLGIPEEIKSAALAYLVVMMEQTHADRLDDDVEALATLVADLGALDVYVLPAGSAAQLIDAREKAFWVAKTAGADEIIDIVVPRASVPEFMRRVSELAQANETLVAGCGHAGDGNVHMSVFQKDPDTLAAVMGGLFEIGRDLGGAISGEHGLGTEKKKYFMELEDPVKIDLMRGIKAAFDPNGILNPGKVFD